MLSTTLEYEIQSFHLFKDLHNQEIEYILDHSRIKTYPKKSILFLQSDPIEYIYFLLEGQVKLYRVDHRGNEHTIDIAGNGDLFPDIGFLRPQIYPSFAEVMVQSSILLIPVHHFKTLMSSFPNFSERLFNIQEDRIIELQTRLEEKILYQINEQVLFLLLRLSESLGTRITDDWIMIETYLSNRELANLIGSTRETINRYLNDFKKKGIIQYSSKGSLLINKTLLHEELDLQKK